jgi:hypothetical protein
VINGEYDNSIVNQLQDLSNAESASKNMVRNVTQFSMSTRASSRKKSTKES